LGISRIARMAGFIMLMFGFADWGSFI